MANDYIEDLEYKKFAIDQSGNVFVRVSGFGGGSWGAAVQDVAALKAITAANRPDKQMRLVESETYIYRYDETASAGNEQPTDSDGTGIGVGNGWWIKISADYIPMTYLDTDDTMTADSDTKVPSQKAVKKHVADAIAGHDTFTELTDVPASYSSHQLEVVRVNSLEDALEFWEIPESDTETTGLLTSTDWDTFNGKQDALPLGSLKQVGNVVSVDDEAHIALPTGAIGWGFVQVGDNEEWAHFNFSSDGTTFLMSNSATVVNTDTDTKFCIIDGGTEVYLKNRLGSAKVVNYHIYYTNLPD